MPSFRKRKADARPTGKAPLRSSLANAAWAVEDRVVLGASDFLHAAVEVIRWPFERIAWAVEHWLVWPIQEETAGWSKPTRAGVLAGVVLLAAVGVAAGIMVSKPSGGEDEAGTLASAPAKVAPTFNPKPKAKVESARATGPVLQGAQPKFAEESGGGVPQSQRSEAASQAKANEGVAAVKPQEKGSAAKGGTEVAGPEAIDVARQFAGAFVLYETGRTDAKVKKAFAVTASPELEKALLKRPPRLPANTKVPKAKVLNIVSGPKSGDAYTLSVSLLRVGVTSELKLEMEKLPLSGSEKGSGSAGSATVQWQVTDVRG